MDKDGLIDTKQKLVENFVKYVCMILFGCLKVWYMYIETWVYLWNHKHQNENYISKNFQILNEELNNTTWY